MDRDEDKVALIYIQAAVRRMALLIMAHQGHLSSQPNTTGIVKASEAIFDH